MVITTVLFAAFARTRWHCVWLHKNELDATSHFGVPPNRVIELGTRLDLLPIETAGDGYLP